MWTISFQSGSKRTDIAMTNDEGKGHRVFKRFKAIHEEAVALWGRYSSDATGDTTEEMLDDFLRKSPVHRLACRFNEHRLLFLRREFCIVLLRREDSPDIEDSPLAELLHGDGA